MQTQDANLQTKTGPNFPQSETNPDGYTLDERTRRQPPKERESKRGRGRKDKDGIEAVPDYAAVKTKAPNLMKLYRAKVEADTVYREGVKGLAESSKTNSGTINKLVKASYNGKFEDAQRSIDQQSEMFESVGEIAGGPNGAE